MNIIKALIGMAIVLSITILITRAWYKDSNKAKLHSIYKLESSIYKPLKQETLTSKEIKANGIQAYIDKQIYQTKNK